jgi:photosystem II stability/assembly factor-like uncharacterized protein
MDDDKWRERFKSSAVGSDATVAEATEAPVTGAARENGAAHKKRTLLLVVLSVVAVAIVAGLVVGINALRSDSFALSFSDVSTDEPGTWTQLPLSGNGGNVTSVAVDPNVPGVVYAMTDNGLFKSTDGAETWTQLLKRDASLIMPEVSVVADSSSTVFVTGSGLFGDALRRSADGGVSWENLGWPDFVPTSWNGRTIRTLDLGSGPFMYVTEPTDDGSEPGSSRDHIWCSYDKGETWAEATGSDREQIIAHRDESEGILTLTDPDSDAQLISLVPPAVDAASPSTMYAGTSRGVYKSQDGGETWKKTSEGLTASAVAGLVVDPSDASTLYASTADGIFKSADGGQTWSLILGGGSPGSLLQGASLVAAPSSPGTLYAWTSAGLFRSDDGGATWRQAAAEGLAAESTFQLDAELCAVSPTDANVVVAATGNGIARTSDGGETWAVVYGSEGTSMLSRVETAPGGSSIMYASIIGSELKPGAEAAMAEAAAGDDETYLSDVVDQQFSLLKSSDDGATWTALAADYWRGYIIDFEVDPHEPAVLYAVQMSMSGGSSLLGAIIVSRSNDGGATWRDARASGERRSIVQLLLDPRTEDTMYALASGGLMQGTLVYRSTDRGKSWSDITGDLNGETLAKLFVDPATESGLYAISSTGLYRWTPDSD